jgi:hypothetical protein
MFRLLKRGSFRSDPSHRLNSSPVILTRAEGAPAFMRGKERFSAPGKEPASVHPQVGHVVWCFQTSSQQATHGHSEAAFSFGVPSLGTRRHAADESLSRES